MNIPEPIASACATLFEKLPIEHAMPRLTVSDPTHSELVEQALAKLEGRADLAAALWLYVDDLDRAHTAAQSVETSTGSWWHGIMHRREGDFSNSRYWMRRAAGHPLITARPDLDPVPLVDAVSTAADPADLVLVARQRQEWLTLFEWCANGEG